MDISGRFKPPLISSNHYNAFALKKMILSMIDNSHDFILKYISFKNFEFNIQPYAPHVAEWGAYVWRSPERTLSLWFSTMQVTIPTGSFASNQKHTLTDASYTVAKYI